MHQRPPEGPRRVFLKNSRENPRENPPEKNSSHRAAAARRWNPRSLAIGAAVSVAYVALALLTHRGLLQGPGVTFGGDARTSYWQDIAFTVGALGAGELPLWNPYERGGYPFLADPQAALWAPLTWLVVLLGVVLGDAGSWLQEVRQLAAPVLAAAGFHLFLRRRGLGHPAAFVAGTILVAGAFAQRTITMATYWPWAYLGLVLVAIDSACIRPGWGRARWLGLTLLLLATAGFPPTIFYGLLIAIPYALLRLASARAAVSAVFATLAGGAAIAGLGAVAVVLPLAEQTTLSWRATRGLDYVLSDPASVGDLWTLVAPLAPGKELFVGLIGLGLALLALGELWGGRGGRGGRRCEVVFWVGISALGLLLALREVGLLAALARILPGFDLFRIASRYAILTHTGLAVLAAYGLDRALAPLVAAGGRRQRLATGLAVVCLIVQVADLQRLGPAIKGRFAAAPDLAADRALAATLGDARVYNEWSLGPRGGSVVAVRDWRGRSKDPLSFARYQEVEAWVARDPTLLRHFAVAQLLLGRRREVVGRPRIRRPSAIPGVVAGGRGIYRVEAPGPEIFWSRELRSVADGAGIAAIAAAAPGTIVAVDRGALPAIERELAELENAENSTKSEKIENKKTGEVIARGRNHLELAIDAPAAGVVVSVEVWHPGWRAEVDGIPVAVHRVHHLLRGVVVDRGSHRIILRFRPAWLVWVLLATVGAWGLILGGGLFRRRRRQRGGTPGARDGLNQITDLP